MAGGIDWFRWHHGSVTDPKFQLVARKSKQALASVIAVWAFVLEQASASEDRGAFGSIDCEAIDCLLGLDDGATADILVAMGERGLVADGTVSAWDKRQPKRERIDNGSTERSRAFRDRQRQSAEEAGTQRHATPETADATPCNATQRQETPREEESRVDKSNTPHTPPAGGRRSRAVDVPKPEDVSDQVWSDWHALRKSKRAAVSATVLAEARSEAAKAGMPLERFLTIWCLRGTQGLMAEWLKPSEMAQPAAPVRAQDREAADGANPRPQWALDAGFPNVYEARNEGCHERTAHLFRNGKRLEAMA